MKNIFKLAMFALIMSLGLIISASDKKEAKKCPLVEGTCKIVCKDKEACKKSHKTKEDCKKACVAECTKACAEACKEKPCKGVLKDCKEKCATKKECKKSKDCNKCEKK